MERLIRASYCVLATLVYINGTEARGAAVVHFQPSTHAAGLIRVLPPGFQSPFIVSQRENSGLANLDFADSFKFAPPYEETSHSFAAFGGASAHGASGRLSRGALGVAASAGGFATAAEGAPPAGIESEFNARSSLSIRFDEQVKFRFSHTGTGSGHVQLNVDGFAVPLAPAGTLDFLATVVSFATFGGAGGRVLVDGSPETGFGAHDLLDGGRGFAAAAWTFSPLDETPEFVGRTPTDPATIEIQQPGSDFGEPSDAMPRGAGTVYISQPEPFYLGVPTQVSGGLFQGALVKSYSFASDEIPISSLFIPTIPAGASLSITYDEQIVSVLGGEVIEFGAEGVKEFTLTGLDPASPSLEPDAILLGLQFAQVGFTNVEVQAVDYIASADANSDGLVDNADLALWQSNYGRSEPATHAQGDADGDHDVDGADFLTWQRQLEFNLVARVVPEPAAHIAVHGLVVTFTYCFRQRIASPR